MESEDIDAARRRAEARRSWPVRIFRLGEEPSEDLSASTTAEQRLAMVEELSRQAWELSGRPWPNDARGELPVRVVRPGESMEPQRSDHRE